MCYLLRAASFQMQNEQHPAPRMVKFKKENFESTGNFETGNERGTAIQF